MAHTVAACKWRGASFAALMAIVMVLHQRDATERRETPMNIAMFTNTFLPHVGGVAESVDRFSSTLRDTGHRVLVVAPWMEGDHEDEPNVVRVPAWEHIWKTDFSLPLPLPGFLHDRMAAFAPEVIHSHHPFLLGDTALRIAAAWDVPVVFTNHTQYDVYTHYLPWDSGLVKRFATRLAAGYANLCDAVIAPIESIRKQLVEAGVESPIKVIPTGVDMAMFGGGDGERFRQRTGIPNEAFLVGHVGRLTQEKNLTFLADAAAEFVAANPGSRFTLVGEGPCEQLFSVAFDRLHCADRLIQLGVLSAVELADAYAAMDVFAFASVTETQGIVLVEAMAAGTPVVAIDAPGARELVRSGINGQLLPREDKALFAATLTELAGQPAEKRDLMRKMARQAANKYAMPDCANQVLSLYEQLSADISRHHGPHDVWHATVRAIAEECQILSTVVDACARAARGD